MALNNFNKTCLNLLQFRLVWSFSREICKLQLLSELFGEIHGKLVNYRIINFNEWLYGLISYLMNIGKWTVKAVMSIQVFYLLLPY